MLSRLPMVGLLLFTVFWHPVSNAEEASPPTNSQEISENAFVVLVAKLGQSTLHDELFGYMHDSSVLVPLGLMMEALKFPVRVDIDAGRAEGWFLAENRRFSLDLARRETVVEGRRTPLPGNLIAQVKDDDIFVDIRLLTEWFPLKLVFDQANLALNIDPTEPLPIQERLARNELRKKLKKRKVKSFNLPYLDLPRSWLSWPQWDTGFDVDLQPNAQGLWSPRLNYSAAVNMSLLTLDSQWFFSGSTDHLLGNARANFSHPGFTTGLLEGTRFSFGDKTSPSTLHVASGKSGIGFEMMNTPLDAPDRFDQITLEDDLPPGWEIELYHNNQLLDFREIGEDGRYRFENIDLLFGENIFRLVAYGPQGQKRERYERYRIGQNMVPPNGLRYRFALSQPDTQLLPIAISDPSSTQNTGEQPYRYYAEMQWGATDWLTLVGRWNRLTLNEGGQEQDFFSLGTRSFMLGSSLEWDTALHANAETSSPAYASRIKLQYEFGKIQSDIQYDYYDHFVSESVSYPTKSVSKLSSRTRGPLDLSIIGLPPIRWTWSSQAEEHSDGQFSMNSNLNTSTSLGSLALSNSLSLSSSESWSDIDSANGSLLFGGRLHQTVRSRGALNYQLTPETHFDTLSLDMNARLFKDLNLGLNTSYDLGGGDNIEYGLTASKNFQHEDFNLGVNLDYDGKDLGVGLGLSFSFGRQNERWAASSERMTGQGAVVTRTFVDQNNNGQYDAEEDTLVENVRYEVNGFEHKTKSNVQGEALLGNLSLSKTSNIRIAPASLPDPFLAPAHPGVALKASLGTVPTIDFPLVSTGEIDGTVYMVRNEQPQAIKADLQLVNKAGNIVQQTRSAYDGFYLFSYVPMGKYQVRIAPKLASQLDPESVKPIDVEIKPGEEFLNGMDMLLKPVLSNAGQEAG